MKVLSICGGLETGLLALTELGVPIEEYHTYEIYEPAIELSKKHFPHIVHHGDVLGADFTQFIGFDLLIAGTCCQSLSKLRAENADVCNGLDGKSGIFWEYVRALNTIRPRWFMLENVVPKDATNLNAMSDALGVDPILIDSNRFSAQDRERYYWTNIPIAPLPKNNPLVLNDIMEPNADKKYYYSVPYNFHGEDKRIVATLKINNLEMNQRVYSPNWKAPTLTCVTGGYHEKKVWDKGRPRKLTPLEYERLQTLPDNFTQGYSDTIRRTLCGNGWTNDVIKHIFGGIEKNEAINHNKNGIRQVSIFDLAEIETVL